jgi:sterol desaturase/sphingolipid hydroxylase (fatty acid hydroxylase superfamily)
MDAVLAVLFGLAVFATLAENLSAFSRGARLFSAGELWADLRCAAAGFAVVALHRGSFFCLYSAVHARAGGFSVALGAASLALVFVVYDLVYYVDHRACHRASFLWASHRIHHETRSFHLLTGLRMSMVGPLLAYGFRLPLAVLGVPPAIYFAVDAVHALLTYFTHARFFPDLRLGWLVNTPAHHRLHHSVEPRHFGKNYGGVFLIWDRLLGTYAPPEPVFEFGDGETREPLGPLRAHRRMLRSWFGARA